MARRSVSEPAKWPPSRGARQEIINGQGESAIRRGRSHDAIASRRISAREMREASAANVSRQAAVSDSASETASLLMGIFAYYLPRQDYSCAPIDAFR